MPPTPATMSVVQLEAVAIEAGTSPKNPEDFEVTVRGPKKWISEPRKLIASLAGAAAVLGGGTIGAMKLLPSAQTANAAAPQTVLESRVDRVEKQSDDTVKRVGALEADAEGNRRDSKFIKDSLAEIHGDVKQLLQAQPRRRGR